MVEAKDMLEDRSAEKNWYICAVFLGMQTLRKVYTYTQ
jgi:hypothetical protein